MDLGKPVTVWYDGLFEPTGIHSLIPVHLVKSRAVSAIDNLQESDQEPVLLAIDY